MKLRSNETFFVDVFRRYFTRVLNYCKRLMRGPAIEMAEECAQNTFVQVQENITALKAHPNLAGWLYTTARNQVNALYRKLYRRRKHEIAISDSIANQLTANSYELYEVLIATLDMDKMVRHVLNQRKRQTLPTFVLCSNHEIILLRINSGEDILWPEKMYRRNGKNELPLSVPAEKKQ